MGGEWSPIRTSPAVSGPERDTEQGYLRCVAWVTTLFHFPERDVQLVEGQPVAELPVARLELLRNLGFVEPLTRDRRAPNGSPDGGGLHADG